MKTSALGAEPCRLLPTDRWWTIPKRRPLSASQPHRCRAGIGGDVSEQREDGPPQLAVFVTTSWDDGHVLDHKLANLLDFYDLAGTFYVAPENVELRPADRLGTGGTRLLAERFEIGGHTLRHFRLPTLSLATARHEIVGGKTALEDSIGRQVRSFCYPGGQYRPEHVRLVDDAGFSVARTVRRFASVASPPLEMPTTVNAYRHLVDGPAMLRRHGNRLGPAARAFWSWDTLAIELFNQIVVTGGVFHLWGHSWEVDERGDWRRLERVLAHIARRPGVSYVDNGDLPVALREAQARTP
jgi:peptidoglycan-N-acetylglucosamine deacetylase